MSVPALGLDTVAAVRENGTDMIRILSKGYPRCEISVNELTRQQKNRQGQDKKNPLHCLQTMGRVFRGNREITLSQMAVKG